MYNEQQSSVILECSTVDWFPFCKGCILLSPNRFRLNTQNTVRDIDNVNRSMRRGHEICELGYTDDTILCSDTKEGLDKPIGATKGHSEKKGQWI